LIGSQLAAHLGLNSLATLRENKVTVVAGTSKNNDHAEAFAKKFSITDFYDDYRRILQPKDIKVADLYVARQSF
jgi:predicted dehydrogenase